MDAVSLASVAAGDVPVDGTIPPSCCPAEPPPVEAVEEGAADPTAGIAEEDEEGATDFAVSVVTLDPMVECSRGIFAAFGAALGANRLAALTEGVAGAAVGGAAMAAPWVCVFPIPATVGIPGTPVPRTGEVGRA